MSRTVLLLLMIFIGVFLMVEPADAVVFVTVTHPIENITYTPSSHTFVDGTIGCENATFEINNTDKSLQLGFNYKSAILNKMTPFIILANGNKHYIKDLLPTYGDRLNFSITQIACGQWKFGLNLSIPDGVNVDYIGFSYENVIGFPFLELDKENKQVRINNGEGAEMIINWGFIADRLSLNKTSKEVLINISGVKEIHFDPQITLVPALQYPTTSGALTENTHTISTQTAIVAGCYDNISSSNNIYCLENEGSATLDPYFIVNFSAPYSIINWMDVTAELKNTAGVDALHLALWNFTSDAFEDVNITANPGVGVEKTLTFRIQGANISTYKNSAGLVRVMPHTAGGSNDDMNLDYVSLTINYNSTGYSTVTFSTAEVDCIATDILTNHTFVIAYCDDVNDDISFQIYDTNGTQVLAETDVDLTSGDMYFRAIGVSAFNSTHFVIGWHDSVDYDVTFAIYNSTGTLLAGPFDADIDVSTLSGASVSTFNSTHFVIGWYDRTDQDATFAIYDSAGILKVGPTDADTIVGDSRDAVSVSTFNSTHFVIGYHDENEFDTSFIIYDSSGTNYTPANATAIDADSNVGSVFAVKTSTFNSTHFVIAWQDRTDSDATFSIYNISGNLILGPVDTDTDTGFPNYIGVSAFNSTHFVVGWKDDTDGDHTFAVYKTSSSTPVTSATDAETAASIIPVDVLSNNLITGTSFCDNTQYFIITYGNTTTQSVWKSFYLNGSAWDGTCPVAGDTTPPTYSLNSTNSTLAGTPVSHNLKWNDETGLSHYLFSFDNCTGTLVNNSFVSFSGTANWSNETKTINSTVGCTIQWKVYANDTSNNWNTSLTYSYLTTSAGLQYNQTGSLSMTLASDKYRIYNGVRVKDLTTTLSLSKSRKFDAMRTKDLSFSLSEDSLKSLIYSRLGELSFCIGSPFISSDNLISWWKFDNNVLDSIGDNDGTRYNFTDGYVSGKYNNALEFNSTTQQYVGVGNHSSLNFGTGDFSVEAWIKPLETGTYQQVVAYGIYYGYWFYISNDVIGLTTDGESTNFSHNDVIFDGNWYHVVVVRNGYFINIYLDGMEKISEEHSTIGDVSTTENLTIGSWGGIQEYFNGTIDNVRIWNKALTSSEVSQLYNEISCNGGEPIRIYDGKRVLIFPMSIVEDGLRKADFKREKSLSMDLAESALAQALKIYSRLGSLTMTLTGTPSRLWNAIKTGTLSFSLTEDSIRSSILKRAGTLSLTLSESVERSLQQFISRLVSLAMSLSESSSKIGKFNREKILSLSLAEDSFKQFKRNIEKSLSLTLSEDSLKSFIANRLGSLSITLSEEGLGSLIGGMISRLASLLMSLSEDAKVYIQAWEEVSPYRICSVLMQIEDSRAYLCVYDTREWKILIKGVE